MYTLILQNASKLFYGSLIVIALYACWNVYDNYTDMQDKIAEQSETISSQKNQLEILSNVADENAKLYFKAKADTVYLTEQINTLNVKITSITNQQQSDISTIQKEIDNAPEQIKQCLRSPLPSNIVSSLRKHP